MCDTQAAMEETSASPPSYEEACEGQRDDFLVGSALRDVIAKAPPSDFRLALQGLLKTLWPGGPRAPTQKSVSDFILQATDVGFLHSMPGDNNGDAALHRSLLSGAPSFMPLWRNFIRSLYTVMSRLAREQTKPTSFYVLAGVRLPRLVRYMALGLNLTPTGVAPPAREGRPLYV